MAGFENDVVYAKNGDFTAADNQAVTEANGLITNGQLWIGSTALNAGGTHINVGVLTSPDASVTIGYSSPNITLTTGASPVVVTKIAVQTGTSPVVPAAGIITFNGALVAAGTNPVRTDGTGVSTMALEVQTSQALAAGDSTKVGLSNYNSTQFTVSAAGFVTLVGGTTPPTLGLTPNTGTSPVIPNGSGNIAVLGTTVAAGTNPIRTDGTGPNTLTIEAQTSQALAAADATKIGLSNFNSTQFTVSATGFVSLVGGTTPPTLGLVPNTGTSPVSPNGSGNINILATTVAAGTNPIRTDGTGVNTLTIEAQISQALAAADATKIGLSNFSSADFAVAATGFVTLSTTGAAKTITGDTGGALSPVANNWNILGGPGVTTSGTGNTLTINSVVFTDTTATTMAVDNGYFATAAGTYNLPATAAQGELIIVSCDTTGAVVIDAPALNFIRLGNAITAASGTITSTAQGDSVTLRYRLSTLTWMATSITGNWIVT